MKNLIAEWPRIAAALVCIPPGIGLVAVLAQGMADAPAVVIGGMVTWYAWALLHPWIRSTSSE